MVYQEDSIEYFVYFLRDPRTMEARYVGITKNPKARRNMHRSLDTSVGRELIWKEELRAIGLAPVMDVILSGLTKDQALAVERRLILVHGFMRPGRLCNKPLVLRPFCYRGTMVVEKPRFQQQEETRRGMRMREDFRRRTGR